MWTDRCRGFLFLFAVTALCLSGCGDSAEAEISIAFPFYETEEYTLALISSKEVVGEYTLTLYDESQQPLQQISVGALTEPVIFSYDGIGYGHWRDLEIFFADCDTGLLFLWEDGRFSENPIRIPRYAEIRDGAMLTVAEEGEIQEKSIYQLNEYGELAKEVRRWSLDRDSGMLQIVDCLRGQNLFGGNIVLNEEGELFNQKYYEYLFWADLYLLRDYSDTPVVRAWMDSETDNQAPMAQYESRQAFLEECGYVAQVPFYQYYDRFGNLQLELYRDEENQKYGGISYLNYIKSDGENAAELFGFTVCGIMEEQWEEDEVYPLFSAYGTSNPGEGYQENSEYTENGKLDCLLYKGFMEDCGVEYLGNVAEIHFMYREDDTLFRREYHHDSRTFSSTLCSLESFFDERERPVYEVGYITHGVLEYYYIYEDEGDTPTFCLQLDYNGEYAIPEITRFFSQTD